MIRLTIFLVTYFSLIGDNVYINGMLTMLLVFGSFLVIASTTERKIKRKALYPKRS